MSSSVGLVRRRGTFRRLSWYRSDKLPLLSGFGPTRQKVERIQIVYSHWFQVGTGWSQKSDNTVGTYLFPLGVSTNTTLKELCRKIWNFNPGSFDKKYRWHFLYHLLTYLLYLLTYFTYFIYLFTTYFTYFTHFTYFLTYQLYLLTYLLTLLT